jgi:ABC-type transport system involved in multi-copper enzyme maturation permease subunit
MPVYKHTYRVYEGRTTSPAARVLVLARYGFAEAWASKVTIGLFIACLVPPLITLFGIYLANNPVARALMGADGPRGLAITPRFFLSVLSVQSWMALVLSAWITPRLICLDLADNAMPILLSHPISRFGYLLGKFIAGFGLVSAVTWVPELLLFAYQGYASQQPWAGANLQVAAGMFVGTVIWIAFLSILGLALSAYVKWRVLATGVIFAAVFVPAGVGAIFSAVLRTRWGYLLNLPFMMNELWQRLLGVAELSPSKHALPTGSILFMLALAGMLCFSILHARIRAREVVKG